uniref:hypothetical protein n=1 Tax=Algoriphagus sp. TaxID=1872435 RepID=UPI0025876D5E|nr:hypothetical protein [Algoriphagus sp.]
MPKLKPNQFYLPCGPLLTELPILFQTEMVQCIITGRKTQTRRTRGLNLVNLTPDIFKYEDSTIYKNHVFRAYGYEDTIGGIVPGHLFIPSPFGKPGDLLWVKETWSNLNGDFPQADPYIVFKSDLDHPNQHGPVTWKPSIHMPKEASRIWLMVEDIRVERLQEISEEDAIAEGIAIVKDRNEDRERYANYYYYGQEEYEEWQFVHGTDLPKFSFYSLWASINGEKSWNANPWLWVIQFRVLSTTGNPSLEIIEKNYLEVTNPPRVLEPLEGSGRKEDSNE